MSQTVFQPTYYCHKCLPMAGLQITTQLCTRHRLGEEAIEVLRGILDMLDMADEQDTPKSLKRWAIVMDAEAILKQLDRPDKDDR